MREKLYRLKRFVQKRIYSLYFRYANNRYAIAFRQRNGNPLYEENCSKKAFILVKNTIRYWRADPFLFKYNGTNYVFAELFDKRKGKGVLGYATLKGDHCSKFKVFLEDEVHLSYPCIFQKDGEIFLTPETKEKQKAMIYRATQFPDKWEIEKVLCNEPCVDTTPIMVSDEEYYFTTIANEKSTDDNLFLIDGSTGNVISLLNDNLCLRSAGHLILSDKKLIRPSQDDTVYGDAVVFNEIECLDAQKYRENPYKRIIPPGVDGSTECENISLINNKSKINFNGLHTYNCNEDYEVIDLRYPRLERK